MVSNTIKRFRGAYGALGQKTKVPKKGAVFGGDLSAMAGPNPSEEPWRAKVGSRKLVSGSMMSKHDNYIPPRK